MGHNGKVRIGHLAPDFQCDAVVRGVIEGNFLVGTVLARSVESL